MLIFLTSVLPFTLKSITPLLQKSDGSKLRVCNLVIVHFLPTAYLNRK